MLAVLAEGHRLLTGEPGSKLLVGLDQAVAANAHDNSSQPVEHVVDATGLDGNGGVQADEGVAELFLDECFLGLAGEVMVGEVVPAEAGDLVVVSSEAGSGRGVIGNAAAEQVADKGFDGVGFVEGHSPTPLLKHRLRSSPPIP